ncbi:hypothetical protein JCM3263A_17310 [Thermobifida fusca]|jgi:hypothetical protein|uniref:Uncharacterized protein n=2 Tax=Thermobifida fusca TaxID=2021 RepID=A0A9P2T992_THEFU|nr:MULTISPECIES: hypothetical protein [Thermobifida]AAZ55990.1 conserved hypothetical protein [Thermobifida fusca YX]EOR71036.1 hypothetical protein TM51_10076 [Thermobifida fusca TM51]MBO2530581.1 hypothetical protein [Thermobifida sp.]MDD6791001.1 hypothetical protein [Thermobifida fusca]PPS91946.1 hypothetical protein BH05_12390 [Thermobifida fusca]
MDPVSLVVGAMIALGGVLVGRLLPNRRSSVPPAQASLTQGPRTPQPICGCGHHLVFHDQKDKTCQAQVVIPGRWTGERTHTYRKCMCQGYRGPMPVDEYYVPDIIDGE